jgi:uncharacterized phage-like protein YoqJ
MGKGPRQHDAWGGRERALAGSGPEPKDSGGFFELAHEVLVELYVTVLDLLGPVRVISGMGLGGELALARAAALRKIPFEAVIAFEGQSARWDKTQRMLYDDLMAKAATVIDASKRHSRTEEGQRYHERNRVVIERSTLLAGVWNEGHGYAFSLMEYASRQPYQRPSMNLHTRWRNLFDAACAEYDLDPHEVLEDGRGITSHRVSELRLLTSQRGRTIPAGRGTITVVSWADPKAMNAARIYVGRGSPLANPYSHAPGSNKGAEYVVGSREEALAAYERYLDDRLATNDETIKGALNEIARPAMHGKHVELQCFAPYTSHADVIARMVAERLATRAQRTTDHQRPTAHAAAA